MNKYILNLITSIHNLTSLDISLFSYKLNEEKFIYSTHDNIYTYYDRNSITCIEERYSNQIFLISEKEDNCFLNIFLDNHEKIIIGPFSIYGRSHHKLINRDYWESIINVFASMDKSKMKIESKRVEKNESKEILKKYKEIYSTSRLNYLNRSPDALENQLKQYLKSGNKEKAIEINKKIIAMDRAVLSGNSLRSLKYSLVCDCALFTRECISVGIFHSKAYAFSDSLIQRIDEINNYEYLLEFENTMISLFCDFINLERNNKYSYLVTKTIEFIQSNLRMKINIDNISENLGVNKSYLCQVFKKETGQTIVQYTTNQIIKECRYLLLNSDHSIAQIAYTFNFCNESYFVSVFKRYTGTTPKNLRKSNF